jgi:hypothetical protein
MVCQSIRRHVHYVGGIDASQSSRTCGADLGMKSVTRNNILATTQLPMHLRRRKNGTFAYAPPRQSWGQNSICGLGKMQIRMFTFHRLRV